MVRIYQASEQGSADAQTDAVAREVRDDAWAVAVAAGFGFHQHVTVSARLAVAVAAKVGVEQGAEAGLLAASTALHRDAEPVAGAPNWLEPDCVLAIATCTDNATINVAWAGDCRVYALPVGNQDLRQVTRDHTVGQRMRSDNQPAAEAAEHDDELVTTLLHAHELHGTAVEPLSGVAALLLTTPGVHRPLTLDALHQHTALAAKFRDWQLPGTVVSAARMEALRNQVQAGNATAVVVWPDHNV